MLNLSRSKKKTIEDEKLQYARMPHIKNDNGYNVGDKHNSRMNNNGKEFIKFTKGNSHQVK
jgi:hypothetical protein